MTSSKRLRLGGVAGLVGIVGVGRAVPLGIGGDQRVPGRTGVPLSLLAKQRQGRARKGVQPSASARGPSTHRLTFAAPKTH